MLTCAKFMKTFVIAFLTIAFVFLMPEHGFSKNPDMSYWTKNISESNLPEEPGLYDFNAEIEVVGSTVHVMWMTHNADGLERKIYYRRSTDNGETWEPKKVLFTDDDMIEDNTYKRMAVDGNTVHIITSHYGQAGTWFGKLTYLRSTDGGATFDPPRGLFDASEAWHVVDLRITADNGKVTIGFRNQCNWCVNNSYIIFNTDDYGNTFTQHEVYSTDTGSNWSVSDLKRIGDNIYLLYGDGYWYGGIVYADLYFAASSNGGTTFTRQRISVPSKDGNHKIVGYFDVHYVPKIATSGNHVYVTWQGLDEEDKQSVFYRRSTDYGVTFGNAVNLSKAELPLKTLLTGHETIAAKGSYVYAVFLTNDSKVYMKRSLDGGANFEGIQELTAPLGTPYIESGWWPMVKTDPSDSSGAKVHVLWAPPRYLNSIDGGATFTGTVLLSPDFSKYFPNRPQMAIGEDGSIHWVIEKSFYSTALCGGGCDDDIFYRRYNSPPGSSSTNKALSLYASYPEDRFDNMHVPASPSINFTSVMTAEIWINPATGSGRTFRILTKVEALSDSYSPKAYQIGTHDWGGARRPNGGICTTDGEFMNWGGEAISDATWTHMAITYDANAGANNFKLYVNGQLSTAQTVTGNLTTGQGLLFLGNSGANLENFVGAIDELRLWNRALTQAEIAANLGRTLNGNETGLAAYYRFDDSTEDLTGNGNDGILMYRETFAAYSFPYMSSLNVSINPAGGGSVTGTGINCPDDCTEPYSPNTDVTLTATANANYTFTGWSGACTGTGNCVLTMNSDRSVTATFGSVQPQQHTLTVSKLSTGSGTVASTPGGIDCGSDCTETYLSSASVTLTATAGADSTFTGWSGACTGTGNCVLTMDSDKSATATFTQEQPQQRTLTVNKAGTGEGTVSTSDKLKLINCGDDCGEPYPISTKPKKVTLKEKPDANSYFAGWDGDCAAAGTKSSCTLTMDSDKNATANFLPNPTLTLTKSGEGNGNVKSAPKGIDCGVDCTTGDSQFKYKAKVTLKAKADQYSTFLGWSGDACSGTTKPTCKVSMDASKNVTAQFGLPDISVSPAEYNFGDVKIKTQSEPVTFTITNNGIGDLKITKMEITGTDAKMFKKKGGGKKTIKPGAALDFSVTFKPTTTGGKTATLRITSNDPDEAVVEISLSGNSGAASATITGTVAGTTVVAVDENNNEVDRVTATGAGSPKSFTLNVPVGGKYRFYFIESEGTANEKVFFLYQGTTNVFNISSAVTIDLGFVDTSSGVAIPTNDALSVTGMTSSGEDKTVPPSLIPVVNYFPLQIGNKWIYSSFVQGQYRNDEIIGTEIINTSTTYIKERIEPAPDNYHEKRWLAYDSSSVLIFRLWGNEGADSAIDFSPPVIENKLSPQVGEKWSYGIPNFFTVNSEVLSVNDTVTVPSGTFTNCIKIMTTATPSGKIHLYHYAPEVGIIRYELIGEWVEELVYAKIGTKTYGVAP